MAKLIPDNLKSRELPSPVRKIAALFEKLSDDVVVWYEPLFDVSGDSPDYVIWVPGQGILVMEVLDAESSNFILFKRNKISLVRNGAEVKIENPIARAMKFADTLAQRIEAIPKLSDLGLQAFPVACLPGVSTSDAFDKQLDRHLHSSCTLFKDDLQDASSIGKAFDRIMGQPRYTFSPQLDNLVRGVVQPDIVIRQPSNGDDEQLSIFQLPDFDKDVFRVMDREQESIAKSMGDGHRIIRGVAGSGKTLVLVFRAKLLARCNPEASYLVVCYTKSLASQLKRLFQEYPRIEVENIDKIAYDYARQVGMKRGGSNGKYEFDQVLDAAMKAVELKRGPRYDAVLIDEAQDLETRTLIFLTKLLKEGKDDLIVVADAAQNIFRRKFSWKQAGIQAQGRTKILRINYRNTREILEFASAFLLGNGARSAVEINFDDETSLIPPESSKRSGTKPKLVMVNNTRQEIAATASLVEQELEQMSASEKITVLYHGNDGVKRGWNLHKALNEKKIEHFWIHKDKFSKGKLANAKERVIVCTTQSAKGLEFARVIVCGVWWDKGDAEVNRLVSYVAMTRATDHLTVVSRGGHELEADLKAAMSNSEPEIAGQLELVHMDPDSPAEETIDDEDVDESEFAEFDVEENSESIQPIETAICAKDGQSSSAPLVENDLDNFAGHEASAPLSENLETESRSEPDLETAKLHRMIESVFGFSTKWISSKIIHRVLGDIYDFEGSEGDIRRALFDMEENGILRLDKRRNLWQLKKNVD